MTKTGAEVCLRSYGKVHALIRTAYAKDTKSSTAWVLRVAHCTAHASRKTLASLNTHTAVFNAYVPTGTNLLDPTREAQMTDRFIGAVKHACQHNAKVVATGDWNHLTEEWLDHLTKLGFRTVARQGVVVIAVRDNDAPILGGLTTENLQTHAPTLLRPSHPVHTPHRRTTQRTQYSMTPPSTESYVRNTRRNFKPY